MHPLRELGLADLRRRTSVKWRTHDDDVLPMFVAEMDVPAAPAVVEAVERAVRDGDTGYPSMDPVYAQAWTDFARWRWGLDVSVERTAPVADLMTGVAVAIETVTSPGDAVVINPPVYPPFAETVRTTGRSLVEVPLGADGRLDVVELGEAFERAAFGGRSVAYLLCSPHNPGGTVHSADELAAVAGAVAEHGVRVVVDEIHAPLVAEGFVPYLSVAGTDDAYAVVSASKAWNLAGLKSGLLVGGAATGEELSSLSYLVSQGPSHLGTIAHVAAMTDGRDWLDGVVADIAANRRSLARSVAEDLPDVGALLGPGTYLGWLDFRAVGLGDDPAEELLAAARVALASGPSFGTGGAGHARLNYGTTPELLAEGVRRIVEGLR